MAPVRVEIDGKTVLDHGVIPEGSLLLIKGIPDYSNEIVGIESVPGDEDYEGYKIFQTDQKGKDCYQNVVVSDNQRRGSFMIDKTEIKASFEK